MPFYILTFMSKISFSLSSAEHEKSFITSGSEIGSVFRQHKVYNTYINPDCIGCLMSQRITSYQLTDHPSVTCRYYSVREKLLSGHSYIITNIIYFGGDHMRYVDGPKCIQYDHSSEWGVKTKNSKPRYKLRWPTDTDLSLRMRKPSI